MTFSISSTRWITISKKKWVSEFIHVDVADVRYRFD